MTFRYDASAKKLDDELVEMFSKEATKPEEEKKPVQAAPRLGQGKTPLDEVRALIDASRAKNASFEIAKHAVRQKLESIRDRGVQAVNDFVETAKRS